MASLFSRRAVAATLAATAVALTTACGGGNDAEPAPSPPAPAASGSGAPASRLIVAGDSLADVGTSGVKATVQKAADRATGYPVYPELVAAALGSGRQCSYFSSTDGLAFTTNPGCTNFAVAGSAIVNPITRRGDDAPLSVKFQLESALKANGAWQAGDLILIDAGSNDAAGLAEAWRDARGGDAEPSAVFLALLGQQLDASTIRQALSQSNGGSVAAGLYMQALAKTFWDDVKANALDAGAPRVALVEIPDLTLTPRLRSIAADIAAAEGATAGTEFQTSVRQWIVGFNTELRRLVAADARVAVVPYFQAFTAQVTTPAAFGLTNTTQASCPAQGEFPQDCTDAALDAAPPAAGLAPGWWKTWFFSDEFHPTPRGHELLAADVERALAQAGWR